MFEFPCEKLWKQAKYMQIIKMKIFLINLILFGYLMQLSDFTTLDEILINE